MVAVKHGLSPALFTRDWLDDSTAPHSTAKGGPCERPSRIRWSRNALTFSAGLQPHTGALTLLMVLTVAPRGGPRLNRSAGFTARAVAGHRSIIDLEEIERLRLAAVSTGPK